MDSLKTLIQAADAALSEQRVLDRLPRKSVARRVCGACWRTMIGKGEGLQDCPWCGGKLHEVVL